VLKLQWLLLVMLSACSWRNTPFPEPPTQGVVRRSNLLIPGQQTFELGGEQAAGFTVRVQNLSPNPVEFLNSDGDWIRIEKGMIVDSEVEPNAMARLRNPARASARLKVVFVQQDQEFLGMQYVENDLLP